MASGLFTLKNQLQALIQGAWSGTSPSNAPKYLEYLVVAGGGSGGIGGGGGGGLLQGIYPVNFGASITVTVGSGGTGGGSYYAVGTNGSNSALGSVTALGGGGGGLGNGTGTGLSGGSGGGGWAFYAGGQGTSGQGNAGGGGVASANAGNGGGGAGTVGLNAISGSTVGANGGAGIASSISGTLTTYSGGGGGAGNAGAAGGSGGVGGASDGATGSANTLSGSSNTGGGSGGAYTGTAGAGGSGIVIVRYRGNVQYFSGGTLNYDSVNNYVVHTFYASGTLAPLTTPVTYGTPNLLTKSLRFRSSASAYLSRTPSSTGSTQKLTYSTWVKRGITNAYSHFGLCAAIDASHRDAIRFTSSNQIDIYFAEGATYDLTTTAVYVDPSAWYHIVVSIDTTQATASNRVILYVNGNQISLSGTQPVQNYNFTGFNVSGKEQDIGRNTAGAFYFDGEIADTYLIDGQALTPQAFGQYDPTTGVWVPMAFVGTYGTNGFHLPFTNTTSTTTLGYDTSGNGNNWTTNNISLTAGSTYDSMNDVPTLTSATASNYAVLNPNIPSSYTISNGNLTIYGSSIANQYAACSIQISSTGKFYWEYTCTDTQGSSLRDGVGLVLANLPQEYLSASVNSFVYSGFNGSIQGAGATGTYATWTNGDVVSMAVDGTTGKIYVAKNGTWQNSGNPAAGTGQVATISNISSWLPAFGAVAGGTPYYVSGNINFGQQPFVYTPPSGYVALNTYNLPTPTIVQGNQYMDANIWPANNGTMAVNNNIDTTNGGGLIWFKCRDNTVSHFLINSVSGYTKDLASNSTAAEVTYDFGFTPTTGGYYFNSGSSSVNQVGYNYVAWQWKAGGSAVSNTSGSITSSVSANTTAGFSIVTYTGTSANATVGHGLGAVPAMIIIKSRGTVDGWFVYNKEIGNTKYLRLNTTDAAATFNLWQSTTPTSSVFYIATDPTVNLSSNPYVAYCFAPVAGFSAFGSYTGNGSATGPFIYTGFKPKFLMIKRTDAISDWSMLDSSRNTYNSLGQVLNADTTGIGNTYTALNFLSNGFNLIWSDTSMNASGGTYIYMAFASNPFRNSNAF